MCAEVRALRSELTPPPALLSKRKFAKLAGIGRDTLARLLKAKRVRTVTIPGSTHPKIPISELDRVQGDVAGSPPGSRTTPRQAPRVSAKDRHADMRKRVGL